MDREPTDCALNNDLILDMIFKNLSTLTLLDCRLVSKKWKQVASDTLRRRPTYVVALSYSVKSFNILGKVLRKTDKHFPAKGLKVNDSNKIQISEAGARSVKNFFEEFGSMFTHLSLEIFKVEEQLEIVKLLQGYLPNLEELVLGDLILLGSEGDRSNKMKMELGMPNLRKIEFKKGHRVNRSWIRPILRGAGKLETVEGVDLPVLKELLGSEDAIENNVGMIQSLVLEYTETASESGLYQSLALHPPRLTGLTLKVPAKTTSIQFRECVDSVLTSSASTLRTLTLEGMQVSWEALPVVFSKLRSIQIGIYETVERKRRSDIVPPGFHTLDASEKFSSLKQVSIVLPSVSAGSKIPLSGSARVLQQYFWEEGTVWNSVDTLELHNHFSPDGMRYLAQVFPNVTQVIVSYSHACFSTCASGDRSPAHLWSVREFRSLRKLVIKDFPTGATPHLDTLLTGMPKETCRNYQTPNQDVMDVLLNNEAFNGFRPYGGLWELKSSGLRELEIAYLGIRYPQTPFMTLASVWYGFKVIPDLRTTLKINRDAAKCLEVFLKPLQPHVIIELD